MVTSTKPKLGGHGDSHGHGGDHHHVHNVFDGKPFSKLSAAIVVWGVAGLGVFIPLYAVSFQNKKHGFTK